jgi:hypothetical protein
MANEAGTEGKQVGPPLLDLTIDNITPNTIRINSQSDDRRLTYLMSRLVTHLHDFARETRLSNQEWMAALNFLVGCGQISSDVRHVSLGDAKVATLLTLEGIHPLVRRSRALDAGGWHQPPQATLVD